jgi:putative glutamine amidotransferase
MKRPVIAITPSIQRTGEEFSDRSINLSLCYTRAVESAGGVALVTPLTEDTRHISRFLDSVDGLMLTGGGDIDAGFYEPALSPVLKKKLGGVDRQRDQMELHLVHQARERRLPILGICRGHQVVNVAFGGKLIVDIPTQVTTEIRHSRPDQKNDPVHEIQIEPGSRFATIFGTTHLAVNSSHHQAVAQIGKNLRVSARAADGVVEAIETTEDMFILGVQIHPERMWSKYPEILRLFQALIAAAARD